MMQTILFLAGYACGALTVAVLIAVAYHQSPRRRGLPAASARQIRRAARANRYEIREHDRRSYPARWNLNSDHEDTHA